MSRPELWLVILGMAAVTLALRGSFLLLPERWALPPALRRALRFVPAAVLAALVVPAVAAGGAPAVPGAPWLAWLDARVIAALVALGVARAGRGVLATLASGMATLWLLTWWLGRFGGG